MIASSARTLVDRCVRYLVRSVERERAAAAAERGPEPPPEVLPTPSPAPVVAPPAPRRPHREHRPPTVDPTRSSWTRDDVFAAGRWTPRDLGEFVDPAEPVEWQDTNPYADDSVASTLAWIRDQHKWRYHHGIEGLQDAPGFYGAYARRVDSMLRMVTRALDRTNVDLATASFVDLGAAEGYTAHHLHDAGARDIDCCDLNPSNIERMWRVRRATGRDVGRIGTIDLDRTAWSRALGRTYDVALALGVVYHMENPQLFCRNLRAVAPVALVESDTPVFPHNDRWRGHGALHLHRDQVTVGDGEVRHLTEMRPDRHALVELLLQAGYEEVSLVEPPPDDDSRYFASGEKTLLLATAGPTRRVPST